MHAVDDDVIPFSEFRRLRAGLREALRGAAKAIDTPLVLASLPTAISSSR